MTIAAAAGAGIPSIAGPEELSVTKTGGTGCELVVTAVAGAGTGITTL